MSGDRGRGGGGGGGGGGGSRAGGIKRTRGTRRTVGWPVIRLRTVETEVVLETVLIVEALLFGGFRLPASARNPGGREIHRIV